MQGPPESPNATAEAAIATAWEAVDQDFEDTEAHERVLALAASFDALPSVAARYKAAAMHEDRRVRADAMRTRIVALALAKLEARAEPSDVPRRVVRALRVVAFLFLVVSIALFVRAVFR